ncbi:MAG: sel1 repeat family protein, partial [Patescibacteria group bacterium]|nr:sel1 repeat family protein [Patescibacteria group bacterium]
MIASTSICNGLPIFAADCDSTHSTHETTLCGDDIRFDIPKNKIPILISKGLNGDGDAAARMAWYYSQIKWDKAKTHYWMRIAAENGDPVSMYNLAIIY